MWGRRKRDDVPDDFGGKSQMNKEQPTDASHAKAELFGGPLDGRVMVFPRTDPAMKKTETEHGTKWEVIGKLPTKDVRIDWKGNLERYIRGGLMGISDIYKYEWWDEAPSGFFAPAEEREEEE
jgi:hypothetical protein